MRAAIEAIQAIVYEVLRFPRTHSALAGPSYSNIFPWVTSRGALSAEY